MYIASCRLQESEFRVQGSGLMSKGGSTGWGGQVRVQDRVQVRVQDRVQAGAGQGTGTVEWCDPSVTNLQQQNVPTHTRAPTEPHTHATTRPPPDPP